MRSAYMRGHFAALQRHPAPVRGENARMKQQIDPRRGGVVCLRAPLSKMDIASQYR